MTRRAISLYSSPQAVPLRIWLRTIHALAVCPGASTQLLDQAVPVGRGFVQEELVALGPRRRAGAELGEAAALRATDLDAAEATGHVAVVTTFVPRAQLAIREAELERRQPFVDERGGGLA